MTRFLVKFMTDDGFLHEICVKAEQKDVAFTMAINTIAQARPGIGILHLFSMEEGVLSDIGWAKIRDVVLA